MPFITADKIHDGIQWLPEGSVIEVADDGYVIAIHSDALKGQATFYEGVLIPGFVNVHCHLELSHMKGIVPEHTGLIPFLKTIPLHRNDFTEEQKRTARYNACKELRENGVVAVGDIANVTDTLDVRIDTDLHFHTFIESIGFTEANAVNSFYRSEGTYTQFAQQVDNKRLLRQSIAPHAPYSVSSSLFKLIDTHQQDSIISIHNQESYAEDTFFISKKGPVTDLLKTLGINYGGFTPSGKSSLQTYLDWLSPTHPFIFIHNTYTPAEDIKYAMRYLKNPYWCFCPNANLYIENRLPDIDLFMDNDASICIGTDSLASNHQLSILSELTTIKKYCPHIDWELLLRWGTYNGACALQMDDVIGSLKPGFKPGIVQVTNLENTAKGTAVKRIY